MSITQEMSDLGPVDQGKRWVRRHGMWRQEPVESEPPKHVGSDDDWIDVSAAEWDHTYADYYDGPDGICEACNASLETVGEVVEGRCTVCAVYGREPEVPAFDPMECRAVEQ